jgi:hypothetical protein
MSRLGTGSACEGEECFAGVKGSGSKPSLLQSFHSMILLYLSQGRSYIDNTIQRLPAPQPLQKAVIPPFDSSPRSVTLHGAARSYVKRKPAFKTADIRLEVDRRYHI